MSSVINVEAEVREEEIEKEVETVEMDAATKARLDELNKKRQALLEQLAAIDSEIARLVENSTKRRVVRVKHRVAYFRCPRCGTEGKLVVSKPRVMRVRCRCGASLNVNIRATQT